MRVSRPLRITVAPQGVRFAESVHAEGFRMARRVDPFHKLIYVLGGQIRYREADRPAAGAGPGTVLVVPRETPHHIEDEATATLLLLCLSEGFLASDAALPRLWLEISRRPGRRLVLSRPGRLRLEGWWRRAMSEQTTTLAGGELNTRIAAAQTLVFLARLPPAPAQSPEANQRVAAVVREIDEAFFEDWSLERGAGRAGLSRRRFSQLFHALTGLTFWNYVIARRMRHAAQLLRRGEHSVVGVMFSCGFGDLSNFYRLFLKHHGLPPKRWAAEAGKATAR
jgi:AraC-like DNA-binding protein/quercetin dioxygenase-like cupin family protein